MIGRLKGLYDGQGEDFAIIDCGGVGYRVFASSRTLGQLNAIGQAVSLEIETQVREDHIHLFGFLTTEELDLFRLLLGVQGVGAKVALAVLSTFSPDQLVLAIGAGDAATVRQVKGVGPKAAQRIVAELKDKVGAFAAVGRTTATVQAVAGGRVSAVPSVGIAGDVASALANLGYQPTQAFEAATKAVQELSETGEPTIEGAIVLALKTLSSA